MNLKSVGSVLTATIGLIYAQTGAPAAAPAFEVASIKSAARPGMRVTESPGEVRYKGATILFLLRKAYGAFEVQVSGPAWLQNDTGFDIDAKIPAAASKYRIHQIPLMLQTLLKERFKLEIHHDQKTMPMYALVVGSKGAKMQAAGADDVRDQGCVSAYVPGGPNAYQCHIGMADLTRELQEIMQEGVPVVDRTGLQGVYDFKLEWTGRVMLNMGRADGIGIHDAVQQQLGLKLEARKEPVDMIVIDHVEKVPTEN